MRKSKNNKRQYKKNTFGLSWISVVIIVGALSVGMGGFMFLSKSARTPIPEEYIVIPDPSCTGDNLHLCTFRIVTVTPSPKPTDEPNGGKKDDDNGGNGDGNNNPPDNGGNDGAPPL